MKWIYGLHFTNVRGDVYGGITAGVVALPLALACGVSSGAEPIAGVYGAIFVGFFAALFGGTPSQVSGPTGPMTVVMAAKGYPGKYESGSEIRGLAEAGRCEGVTVFHAGTKRDGERVLANGGRVLNITARGANVAEARDRAYAAIENIDWTEGFCRSDIGWRAINRENSDD